MQQRLIAAVLAVLGLAGIALAVASATVWRPDDTITATGRAADGTTLLVTAPGVLELADPPVTVRATADAATKVVLAIGRDTDVGGWVGTDAHTVVTGLSDWDTLSVDHVATTAPEAADPVAPAEGAAATDGTTAPDPDGSDLWVVQETGEGAAELVWTPQDGRWTLLAAGVGEGAGPPSIELVWPRTVTTPYLVPGLIGGVVLLLIAVALALRARGAGRAGRGGVGTGAGVPATAGATSAAPGATWGPGATSRPVRPEPDDPGSTTDGSREGEEH